MMRDFTPMDPTEALRRLQVLVQSEPDLRVIRDDNSYPAETLKWLGELDAVIGAMKLTAEKVALKFGSGQLVKSGGRSGAEEVRAVLYKALAAAEFNAPASEQGAFIAAGNELDAYAAISKVLASAKRDLLVVDPYLDGKALTDFMPSAVEGVALRVMVDEASVKPTLAPATEKWKAQFDSARPLEVRVVPARSLHDRLILVDESEAWSLTQSLKDFAGRAPGSILKADPEIGGRKIAAYGELWNAARPI
jgi:hypothetical protein